MRQGVNMPLKTTVIGSFPKPQYLPVPQWFRTRDCVQKYMSDKTASEYTILLQRIEDTHFGQEFRKLQDRAVEETINHQVLLGIDVITDGEIIRENYIFHFCRKLNGFDFENLVSLSIRNGACSIDTPNITGTVACKETTSVVEEWKKAQALTSTPVKMTIPGPMTIIGSTHNSYYKDVKNLSKDLAKCINIHLHELVKAGCKYVQVDEPVLVRNPDIALDYGLDHLKMCIDGLQNVNKTVHLCCGYPQYLDEVGYMKADQDVYFKIAEPLDNVGFDQISIEDAHRYNDLSLLKLFKKSSVIFGVVTVAESKVETKEQIRARVMEALKYIPAERLILAPDCGLGFLPLDILKQKLTNMVAVAKST